MILLQARNGWPGIRGSAQSLERFKPAVTVPVSFDFTDSGFAE